MNIPEGYKVVKVSAHGVQFGNAWFSHESITGYTADQLNAGTCHVTGGAYMAWLSSEEPGSDYDEAKERELFEGYALEILGPYFMKPQDCLTRSGETYTYGQPATAWCAWKACAKSRARSAE